MKLFKKKFKVFAAYFVAALLGLATTAMAVSTPIPPGGVPIESSLAVANATQGTPYKEKVDAKPDEVVNVQVWYHNPTEEDSGRVARDLNVKITLPGTMTKNHVITSRVGGSNTNIETHTVAVSTSIDTNISYIPGSAIRRYNSGTNANPVWVNQKISDSIVTSGFNLSKLEPCWNFQESITIQARLTKPLLSIVKQVKTSDAEKYVTENTAKPGDTLNYKIIFKNEGNTELRNVMIRDNMPPGLEYIKGSAKLYSTIFPNGTTLSDAVTSGGANIGHYAPGANAVVRIDAKVPSERPQVGTYTFNNIANAKADGTNEFYNSVFTRVTYRAQEVEKATLKIIKFYDINGNKIHDEKEERLSGWQFNIVGPNGYKRSVVIGENGSFIVSDLVPGTYTITEVLRDGWINTTGLVVTKEVRENQENVFLFGNRKKDVPVPPEFDIPETSLPVTGPLDMILPGLASLGASGGILSWVRSKKNLAKALRKN